MGSQFFFDEVVPKGWRSEDRCQLEMADCNGLPSLRVGPVTAAHDGYVIMFDDWRQFERFADAVEGVRGRLEAKSLHALKAKSESGL